ncbi:MAG TPA: UbiA prenyltransferase family protein [Coriobacteriia bacterium]|jgi:4-hydroxybenzoate polyprenyltransferase
MRDAEGLTAGDIGVHAALFDLSRGRQALLSVAQPALGALLAAGRLPDARVVAVGLVAATAGYLAVFSLNDVLDLHVDERALAAGKDAAPTGDVDTVVLRHPLAQGVLSRTVALAWVGSLAAVALVGAAALGGACVLAFAAAVALEVAYCALRSVTWAKTFLSGAMVGIGGLAGWVAVAPLGIRALPFFALLAAWEIAGRNLPNDLADIAADSAVGLRTVATTFGPRVSADASALGAYVTAAICLVLPAPPLLRVGALLCCTWSMAAPALGLASDPTPERAGSYFNRASLFPALAFAAALAGLLAR